VGVHVESSPLLEVCEDEPASMPALSSGVPNALTAEHPLTLPAPPRHTKRPSTLLTTDAAMNPTRCMEGPSKSESRVIRRLVAKDCYNFRTNVVRRAFMRGMPLLVPKAPKAAKN
jgi:hypothetical protein